MLILFKKYLFAIDIVLVIITGFSIGSYATLYIEQALSSQAEEEQKPENHTSSVTKKNFSADFQSILDRNIFQAKREVLNPVTESEMIEEPAIETVRSDIPQKSSLNYKVENILLASDPQWSLALLRNKDTNEMFVFGVGSLINETAIVTGVDEMRVSLDNAGRKEYIPVNENNDTAAQAPPLETEGETAEKPETAEGEAGNVNVKKISENVFEIPSSEIENTLSNLSVVATQARIVPSFQSGKSNGFKLFSIKPDSIYSKLGIKNGDIIQRINGYEMTSPDKALEVYQKLRDASTINIDVIRRGKNQTMTYHVR